MNDSDDWYDGMSIPTPLVRLTLEQRLALLDWYPSSRVGAQSVRYRSKRDRKGQCVGSAIAVVGGMSVCEPYGVSVKENARLGG